MEILLQLYTEELLFSESHARFLIEVERYKIKKFLHIFKNIPVGIIGSVTEDELLTIQYKKKKVFDFSISLLKSFWKKPMKRYF